MRYLSINRSNTRLFFFDLILHIYYLIFHTFFEACVHKLLIYVLFFTLD